MLLAGEIFKVIAGQVWPMADPVLRHEQAHLALPMRPWDADADLSALSGAQLDYFEQCREQWPRLMREDNPVETRLHGVRLGDAALCFNPAELFVEFGLALRKRSGARMTLMAELSDGYIGYVPTPEAIRHGGYSALPAPHTQLVPEAGWAIVDRTEDLLRQAFPNTSPTRTSVR